jgi:hypothetical protein
MQETRNKMPAASVYLLENLHFSQFFVADSVPGSIIISKKEIENNEDNFPQNPDHHSPVPCGGGSE